MATYCRHCCTAFASCCCWCLLTLISITMLQPFDMRKSIRFFLLDSLPSVLFSASSSRDSGTTSSKAPKVYWNGDWISFLRQVLPLIPHELASLKKEWNVEGVSEVAFHFALYAISRGMVDSLGHAVRVVPESREVDTKNRTLGRESNRKKRMDLYMSNGCNIVIGIKVNKHQQQQLEQAVQQCRQYVAIKTVPAKPARGVVLNSSCNDDPHTCACSRGCGVVPHSIRC